MTLAVKVALNPNTTNQFPLDTNMGDSSDGSGIGTILVLITGVSGLNPMLGQF